MSSVVDDNSMSPISLRCGNRCTKSTQMILSAAYHTLIEVVVNDNNEYKLSLSLSPSYTHTEVSECTSTLQTVRERVMVCQCAAVCEKKMHAHASRCFSGAKHYYEIVYVFYVYVCEFRIAYNKLEVMLCLVS